VQRLEKNVAALSATVTAMYATREFLRGGRNPPPGASNPNEPEFMSGRYYRRDGNKFGKPPDQSGQTAASHGDNPTGHLRPADKRVD
jgi:hypothetical protein